MKDVRAYIGTSGWNYPHWRERFYPRGLHGEDWLEYYARHFDTVEINNTFYRIPDRKTVEHWGQRVHSRFRFAVKMWRGVSHFKKLKDCREHLVKFFAPLDVWPADWHGPILVQLPSNQGKDLDKLDAFLDVLKDVTHPSRWKIAFEFRNSHWLCEETYALLDRRRVAICLHDMPPADVDLPGGAAFVYVRRHGTRGDYRGNYSDDAIMEDARRIEEWLDMGRMVFVYYNNDEDAHAVDDAKRLEAAVRFSPKVTSTSSA